MTNYKTTVSCVNRRDLVKFVAASPALGAIPACTINAPPLAPSSDPLRALTLSNRQFQLNLAPGAGLQCRVTHLPTGMLLADLGADVVKVEPPAGDQMRGWPPFAGRNSPSQITTHVAQLNQDRWWSVSA